ncbi:hypothetical protein R3P38DRAFT_3421263 [Favolaschia claudopus]|uniref:Uncharacterized protein n=1 Tax=Favolaschia claudopus TaxID=2862362 RepID=A0AAW0D437_9AGAR
MAIEKYHEHTVTTATDNGDDEEGTGCRDEENSRAVAAMGYHTLHDTELAKTLQHCSRLKYFAFNPQVASNPSFEIFLPKFPPIPKNLDPWTITHFDICDDVPYHSIIPVLLHLSSTLQSLSIALPTEYGPDHVMITFPCVHSLRLSIARESIQPGAYWAFPYLQQLLLSPSPCLQTEWPFSSAATAFLGKYGRTLRTLCLGKANDNHTLKELLAHCPMLQYLTLAEHWLPPQAYCCHEKLQSLDVYSDSSCRDPSHWPTMFPSLRSSRRVDISHDLYPSLPAVQGSDTQLDYSLPARSYLEFLLAEGDDTEVNEDSDYQSDEDLDESGDTDTSNFGSDSEGDSDSSYPDSPFTEGDADWEIEREEAIEIFRRLVRRE